MDSCSKAETLEKTLASRFQQGHSTETQQQDMPTLAYEFGFPHICRQIYLSITNYLMRQNFTKMGTLCICLRPFCNITTAGYLFGCPTELRRVDCSCSWLHKRPVVSKLQDVTWNFSELLCNRLHPEIEKQDANSSVVTR